MTLRLHPWWPIVWTTPRPRPDDATWRALRRRVLYRDGWRCRIRRWRGVGPRCGKPAEVVDHIIPLWWEGSNREENLQASCWHCNEVKGAHAPLWWIAWLLARFAAWVAGMAVATCVAVCVLEGWAPARVAVVVWRAWAR